MLFTHYRRELADSFYEPAGDCGIDLGDYHGFLISRNTPADSLRKIKELRPALLVPAHGEIMEDPAAAIDSLIDSLDKLYTNYAVSEHGTPKEVRQEARRVRNLMSENGGYIFAPSQEIQVDVPAENIIALIEAAREPA